MNNFRKFYHSSHPYGMTALDTTIAGVNSMVNPYILEERQLNVTQMDVFSRLMMDRIIFINGEVRDESMSIVTAQLLYLDSVDPTKDISLYINSPGGSVTAGYGAVDTMEIINAPVATIVTGMAASMGAILLCCGEKGKRGALPHSRIMIHQPLGGVSGQASDIEIEAREISKMKKELIGILAEKSGQDFDKVMTDCDRNYWMTSQEALDYGLIDSIYKKEKKEG